MAATPIAPSPVSAASSPAGIVQRAPTVTKIVTSKEWVLPPRPKPGRKPSADTPATKRKAQNRAAQRAFRERRATRVAELEAKLSEVEKEKDVNELNYKNIVNKLQVENKVLTKSLNDLKAEFTKLKQSLAVQPNSIGFNGPSPAIYSNGQVSAPSPLNFFKPSPPSGISQEYKFPEQRQPQQISPQPRQIQPQLLRQSPSQPMSPAVIKSPLESQPSSKTSLSSNFDDCGVCDEDDCICAQVGLRPHPPTQKVQLDSFVPLPAVSLKRTNAQAEAEVDYTAKFAKSKPKPMPKFKKAKKAESTEQEEFASVLDHITDRDFESPMEQCGFCSDDSPCVCREAAKEAANAITELQNKSRNDSTALPPISRHSSVANLNKLPVLHPGPSVEISSSSVSPPVQSEEKKVGCTGNPGTCSQCQLDPMSTLFCTTIASKAEEEGTDSAMKQEDNRSPVSPPVSSHSSKVSSPITAEEEEVNSLKRQRETTSAPNTGGRSSSAGKGIYIPCADAYKTLSRHKGFHAVDFSTLVGKLTTRGMQVEVQSVANVLRELDRRLYN
jgi:hypothetical protein